MEVISNIFLAVLELTIIFTVSDVTLYFLYDLIKEIITGNESIRIELFGRDIDE